MMAELKAAGETHLSKQCCQRSHDVVLHHVLTHLLTSTCTQIPGGGRHTLIVQAEEDAVCVCVGLCVRGRAREVS